MNLIFVLTKPALFETPFTGALYKACCVKINTKHTYCLFANYTKRSATS